MNRTDLFHSCCVHSYSYTEISSFDQSDKITSIGGFRHVIIGSQLHAFRVNKTCYYFLSEITYCGNKFGVQSTAWIGR